jgi:ribosomal protein L11 methylase PrmA
VATRPRLVWDLGANVGHFSRIASEGADYVVAMDADPVSVDHLYRNLRHQASKNVLPLVMNLANPSPDQGWAGTERRTLLARGRPELILCLALVHHMAIGANVPLQSFLGWLAGLGAALVIEFVTKEDPMTRQLLLNKDDTYDDYNRSFFESCLSKHFQLRNALELPGGTRVLYSAMPLGT